jgi:hypothetical protein
MEVSKMKKITSIAMLAVLCVFTTTSYAVMVYQNDYESAVVGSSVDGWLWTGNAATTHVGVYASYDGSIVRQHTSAVTSTGGTTGRYGYKVDIAVTGNTSTNPADYTIEFDLRNLSGNWDPIPFQLAVQSEPENYGKSFPDLSVSQAAGWVHAKFKLSDYSADWWNGGSWDLLKPTWSYEIGMPNQAVGDGQSWTQVFLVDNLRIYMGSDPAAQEPSYNPQNPDGTVGSLFGQSARLHLKWKAGGDPGSMNYRVNPAIKGHYIYLSTSNPADPNINYLGYVAQAQNADPNLTDPNNVYPTAPTSYVNVAADTTYRWKVEEAIADPNGGAYPKGDSHNIMGPVWRFKTISITPTIATQPNNAVADASGNASFSAKGSASANNYRWYKVVGAVGGGDDVKKAQGTLDSTKITTLNITGATQADEGLYYCIVYYGNPDTTGVPSAPSNTAELWISRLIGYWTLDGNMNDSVGTVVPGAPVHDGFMKTGTADYEGGKVVSAMKFSNDGQFMELPNADYFNFYQDGFTFNFWYKPNAEVGSRRPMSKYDPAVTRGWLFERTGVNSGATFTIENATGNTSVVGTALTDGQWSMVTVTYNSATDALQIFTNGAAGAQATVDLSTLLLPVNKPVQIGGDDESGTGTAVDASIDDVRMYSYPLTPLEIATMYTNLVPSAWVCVGGNPVGDLTGDCRVNMADLAEFASRWLNCNRIPTGSCIW